MEKPKRSVNKKLVDALIAYAGLNYTSKRKRLIAEIDEAIGALLSARIALRKS